MKDKKQNQIGFTLIEMLVVIAVIALLAALLFPAVNRALAQARQTKCMSHLRSFGMAWNQYYLEGIQDPYNTEIDAVFPWLSSMYPDYMSDETAFICPSDQSRGTWGGKPTESPIFSQQDSENYSEADDNANNPASGQWAKRNPDVERNSYLYEFNDADCSWFSSNDYVFGPRGLATTDDFNLSGRSHPSWGQVKLMQLQYGDRFSQRGYDRTQFPLVRCFHHFQDREVTVRDTLDNTTIRSFRVLNVAVSGNVFMSGLQWEFPLAR
ncbi:MAG: prepilin-type N-terminal cleavage/methylation domain-containing protein [Verrucomicrobia bacterium]|nr:prepilin-type N-terminal cleavage/methylation domain-containing protein [Verrucomicrobiota bacterium]